ncbi:MAG: TonB-dependent receptor [Acidobacteria bacterium]|nr:TonB-dependent receptor [Acidobacteriota bacterium]
MAYRPLVLFFAFLLSGTASHAQLASSGQVEGVVVDSQGAAVPDAEVRVQNLGTGAVRTVASNEAGRFQFTGLPIGRYSLAVNATGFAPFKVELFFVSVGQTVVQRVEVAPGTVVQKLEVKGETEALQAAATTTSIALGYDRIEETPSQNRNYLSFVYSAPGMSPSSGANTQRSASGTHNVANDSGFVFAGLRGRNNSISIDGVDNRDETDGNNRVAIGLEMVQEFRVSGTSVNAEFGGAAGGIVNVVTRSGTNRWRGDVTMFLQNEALNARNAEVTLGRKQQYRRYQPGASLNGPIKKDRTFFATAIETAWESGEEWSETGAALRSRLERALASPFYAGRTATTLTSGLYPEKGHDTETSFKLNHAITPKHSLTSRYAFSQGRVDNDVIGVDNFSDLSARGSSLLRDHSFVSALTSALSPSRVNDLRLQIARRDSRIRPNSPGPMIEIPGVITFGGAYRLDQERVEKHYEVVDSFNAVLGSHLVTMGASVHHVSLDATLANRFAGLYVFPTVADFEAGRPDVFVQAFGEPRTNLSTTPIGMWLQDRWQALPGVTIEAGLRYDRQRMPSGIPSSSNNIAPRLGFAWRPGSMSPWVLRIGMGLFYDRYPLAFLNDAIQKDGLRGFEQYAVGPMATRALLSTGGSALPAAAPWLPRARYTASRDFPSTYSARVTAGVERLLDRDTTVSVEYTFARGLHLPRLRNIGGLPQPLYLLEQTARSDYQGATVTINRRMAKEFAYLLTYTAGRARDDASDFDEQPNDPSNLRAEWALSRQHQLHRLTASALFKLPVGEWRQAPRWIKETLEGLTIAPVFTYGSGRPLNVLDSTDSRRSGAYPISSRPFDLGRNPNYGPSIRSLDLRVFKVIKVMNERAKWHVGAESFNLLNRTNSLRVSPYYAAAGQRLTNYDRPVEVMNARQIQLFAAFEF